LDWHSVPVGRARTLTQRARREALRFATGDGGLFGEVGGRGGRFFGGVEEAVGEVHGDAAGGDVDGVDPGQDEGDKDGLGGGSACGEFDGEEGGGVLEAGAAVGGGGEFDVDDRTDGIAGGVVGGRHVVDGAAQQVADEEGAGIEGGELAAGDEELLAGEGFGGGDGVAAGELEDDAAGVLAGGEKVLFDAQGGGSGRGRRGVRGAEDDIVLVVEEAG